MAERSRIWLTRPQEDSEALAALLAPHGIESIIAPVMRIESMAINLLNDSSHPSPEALLLTSRHAVATLRTAPQQWRALPVFCVGTATAAMVREAGFAHVIEGAGDVLALLPMMVAQLPSGAQVLYLAGEETRVDVVTLLRAQQITCQQLTCYTAIAETVLDAQVTELLKTNSLAGTALFSPRSAQVVGQLLSAHGLAAQCAQVQAYCLSLAVAEAAAALPWRTIRACHVPTREAMVDLITSCEAAVL